MKSFGRLLRIDLAARTWTRETVEDETLRQVIGGRGLSSRLLADAVDPTADPLGPGNRLVFTTGPATGTTLPLSGRVTVGARSPLAGTVGFSSGGEFFGPPSGSRARTRWCSRAGELWGLDTHATCDRLRRLEADRRLRVACIGPAGENLVRFACVVNDKYGVAARGGLGAVMGAKRLKAVAAPSGPPAPVARPERVEALRQHLRGILERHPYMQLLSRYGTTITVDEVNRYGLYPTRNFQAGFLPGSERYHDVLFGDGWVVADRHGYEDPLRQYKLADVGGDVLDVPEYESTFALGGLVGIPVARDPAAVLRANHLCNTLGMDRSRPAVRSPSSWSAPSAESSRRARLVDCPSNGGAARRCGRCWNRSHGGRGSVISWPMGSGAPRSGSGAMLRGTPCT